MVSLGPEASLWIWVKTTLDKATLDKDNTT